MEHTKGPWQKTEGGTIYKLNEDGTNIFHFSVMAGHTSGNLQKHGTKLVRTTDAEIADITAIARAAPELLEALEETNQMLDDIASGRDWGAIEDQINDNAAAIRKARGKA